MTDFASYYRLKFRDNLNTFFSTIPDESRFHEDHVANRTFSIQYERLTRDFDHLDFLSVEDKVNFGVALFFTVLTDMVCYAHFKEYYRKFHQLTLYPKFIGNCPGGCHYHFHPSDIFIAMNRTRKNPLDPQSKDLLEFRDKFVEAVPIMEEEVREFFTSNLFDDGQIQLFKMDWVSFWDKCKAEFPFRTNTE